MARQWRIQYPIAIPCALRGKWSLGYFFSDKDRHAILDLLEQVSERFGIVICAYVLMDNHYHLLVKTPEANLSKAMQWLGTAFTRRFHIHNHSSGHLFQVRYQSIIVENEAYLLRLSCYIHRNPLRAKLVDRLIDYPWIRSVLKTAMELIAKRSSIIK